MQVLSNGYISNGKFSNNLFSGDRINSLTISFEHMVYEDALTILSYASPYEVIIEAKSGKLLSSTPGQGGQPSHPVYRSSSFADLYNVRHYLKDNNNIFSNLIIYSRLENSLKRNCLLMTTTDLKVQITPLCKSQGAT